MSGRRSLLFTPNKGNRIMTKSIAALSFVCIAAAAGRAEAQAVLAPQLTINTAWPAPAGHFQPRARDIPVGVVLSPSRQEDGEDRSIDEKLKICRGC
jgi:hypothetical protein